MQLRYEININNFNNITGSPIAYWASKNVFSAFLNKPIDSYGDACKGLDTCDNDTFVRAWFEVDSNNIGFHANNALDTFHFKWFVYCKGGDYRRWYGNNDKIVLWQNDGEILRNFKDKNGKLRSRPQNTKYYFSSGLTFNSISSSYRAIRFMDHSVFGGGGSGLFPYNAEDMKSIAGLINSNTSSYLFKFINSGLNFLVGDLLKIPFIKNEDETNEINSLVDKNIENSKKDWDSFETSWDFKKHPLV